MNLTILRASAGSGKTFALTAYYLELLLTQEDPSYFRHILAVTFTRKATAEMKERILAELKLLATGKDSAHLAGLLEKLEPKGIDEEALRSRATHVVTALLHDYGNFQVRTIDSFFQQLVRSFAWEVDLPANYKLQLDSSEIFGDLTSQLMLKAESDSFLREIITDLAKSRLEEGKSWDVRSVLAELLGELVKEDFDQIAPYLEVLSKDPEKAGKLRKNLENHSRTFMNKVKKLGKDGKHIIDTAGLTADMFKGKSKGVYSYFNKLSQGEIDKLGTHNTIVKALKNDDWASHKSHKEAVDRVVFELGLRELAERSLAYKDEVEDYLCAKKLSEKLPAFIVLSYYNTILQEYRAENNLLLNSDISRLLTKIIGDDDAPFVYEKAGARLKHFLIDEFQDTSRMHWGNFMPLLNNSLAEGNNSLIVGDTKQSIYRWRGGDLRLMAEEVEQAISQTLARELETNWRSLPEVVKFNNRVFKGLASLVVERAENDLLSMNLSGDQGRNLKHFCGILENVYSGLEQQLPAHKKDNDTERGFVCFQHTRGTKGGMKYGEKADHILLNTLENVKANGYQDNDICLLVRSNKDAVKLASFLSAHNYPVLSEEALKLNSAKSVRLLACLLRYLHNFKDQPALAEAVQLFAEITNKPEPGAETLSACANDQLKALKGALPEEFLQKAISISRLPLYDLVLTLARIFSVEELKSEEHYLESFLQEVHRYSFEEKGDLHGFLEFWEDRQNKLSLKRDQAPDAIRVQTIHKSKGLQYPIVILPNCNWGMKPQSPTIWVDSHLEGKARFHLLEDFPAMRFPVSWTSEMGKGYFAYEYGMELLQSYLDNLNLLYVALTRAEEGLFITSETPSSSSSGYNVSHILYDFFQGETMVSQTIGEDEQIDYEEVGFGSLPVKACAEKSEVGKPILPYHVVSSWQSLLRLRLRSEQRISSDNVQQRIDYGILVHEVLSRLTTADKLEAELEVMELEGRISREDREQLYAKLKVILSHPQITDWFSEGWTVMAERALLLADGRQRRPDRVIIKGSKAIVIDYKTGEAHASHHKQVKAYLKLLEQMGYSELSGFLLYLNENEPKIETVEA